MKDRCLSMMCAINVEVTARHNRSNIHVASTIRLKVVEVTAGHHR